MLKKKSISLSLALLCCSSVFAQSQNPTNEASMLSMDEQNLVGNWQCQTNTPVLRYTMDVVAKANKIYNDQGSGSMLINGKWVGINFKGVGHWGIQSDKTLTLSDYKTTSLQLSNMNQQEQQQAKKMIRNPLSQNGKIVRLGAKMLVVEYKDQQNKTLTSRCTKRSA